MISSFLPGPKQGEGTFKPRSLASTYYSTKLSVNLPITSCDYMNGIGLNKALTFYHQDVAQSHDKHHK